MKTAKTSTLHNSLFSESFIFLALGLLSFFLVACDGIVHSDLYKIANTKRFVPVTGLAVFPSTLSFFLTGPAHQLTAVVSPNDATDQTVFWSSADTNLATVSSTGLVSQGPGAINNSTVTITATTHDGGKTAFCNVTFTNAVTPVTGISLDKTTMSLSQGGATGSLQVTINPSTATVQTVTWSTDNSSVASVSPTSTSADQAIVTITSGSSSGTAIITATLTDAGSPGSPFTASCTITVSIPVATVTIDQSVSNLLVGETTGLTATVLPSNATNPTVAWSSSAPGIVSVNATTGQLTGLTSGSATITASADGVTATRVVAVTTPAAVPVLGTPPASGGSAYTGATMALDPVAQLPIIVFRDSGANGTVSRWLGSSWSAEFSHFNVGAVQVSTDMSQNLSIAVDASGNPYVAYLDGSSIPQVVQWNGSAWTSLGAVLGSTTATYLSLSIGKYHSIFGAGTNIPESPFIAFVSSAVATNAAGIAVFDVAALPSPAWVLPTTGTLNLAGPFATSISMVTNPLYNFVGSPAFVASMINSTPELRVDSVAGGLVHSPISAATFVSLALDNQNKPYLAYQDFSGNAVLVVANGTTFTAPVAVSSGSADHVSLAIDTRVGENVAYISFKDNANGGVAAIWKYENGIASVVIANASGGAVVDGTKLLVNAAGHLFLLYESGGAITVKDFAR